MINSIIPYVGAKHRIGRKLAAMCKATGAEKFVDVFGGSGAVTVAASELFQKLIYNDVDGDLVNLFRVLSDARQRRELLRILRWTPPSRRIFMDDYAEYAAAGFSFSRVTDPVGRARRTFYRHYFAFGAKTVSGGFSVSATPGRENIKEVLKYRNGLRRLGSMGELFRRVLIENLHYSELISVHGRGPECVLFVDPPYDGTEGYYARTFGPGDHAFLANQLEASPARAVCTYYDTPLIRNLYPQTKWAWTSVEATKNSGVRFGKNTKVNEFVIIKL